MRRSPIAIVLATMLVVAGAAGAEDETPIIPWNETDKHVGESVIVEGYVLGKHCSPTSCLLAFDPSFNRFTAVIQAKDFKTFSPDALDAKFVGRKVRVKGKIQMLEKKPEIVVAGPDDLQVVTTAKERAEQRAAAQDEVVDRMTDILERLEALVARVEATQARLEEVATALADQGELLAELQAAAAAPPPPVEPEPSYGEPQPRPAYEALRTIKRGMTSEQVERLVGAPLMSESNVNGSFVWYYGYGRSVTFDRRNRAVALVGFPTS